LDWDQSPTKIGDVEGCICSLFFFARPVKTCVFLLNPMYFVPLDLLTLQISPVNKHSRQSAEEKHLSIIRQKRPKKHQPSSVFAPQQPKKEKRTSELFHYHDNQTCHSKKQTKQNHQQRLQPPKNPHLVCYSQPTFTHTRPVPPFNIWAPTSRVEATLVRLLQRATEARHPQYCLSRLFETSEALTDRRPWFWRCWKSYNGWCLDSETCYPDPSSHNFMVQ